MTTLTLQTPDDWHTHLRDGDLLSETVAATGRSFARAIVMPNLVPPVTDGQAVNAYRQRIESARSADNKLEPLMTIYLTNNTTGDDILAAKAAGAVAAKLYPAGATTNSDAGVATLTGLYQTFEVMAQCGMLLLIHGEVTDPSTDIFDREALFIEQHLKPLMAAVPHLRIVLEHITTKEAAEYVAAGEDRLGATITPQHLLLNRNDLLVGGIKPHNYCLPILKRNIHQQALREMVASGHKRFFLGTDSAPHEQHKKESACGCAGCYSAWSAIELYAEVFDQLDCLDLLEAFASHNGADFYGLPRNSGSITLAQTTWQVPESIRLANGHNIVPFFAGQTLNWKLAGRSE